MKSKLAKKYSTRTIIFTTIVVISIVAIVVRYFMKNNKVIVPSIIGLDKTNAIDIIQKHSLTFNVTNITVDSDDSVDKVVSQSPIPNQKVNKKSLVNIGIGVVKPSTDDNDLIKVIVPELSKLTINDAIKEAIKASLVLEVDNKVQLPKDDPNIDLIVSQEPLAGTSVEKNTTIKVDVGILSINPDNNQQINNMFGNQVRSGILDEQQFGGIFNDGMQQGGQVGVGGIGGVGQQGGQGGQVGAIDQQGGIQQGAQDAQGGQGGQVGGVDQQGGIQQPQIVPDIMNKTIREAKRLLIPLGLSIGTSPSVCSDDASLNNKIASQSPTAEKPLSDAIQNKVNITIYSNTPIACRGQQGQTIPNIVGKTENESNTVLSPLNLRLVINEPKKCPQNQQQFSRIMTQRPTADRPVSEALSGSNGSVFVDVYKDSICNLRLVPNVIGMNVDNAQALLSMNNLRSTVNMSPNNTVGGGIVWKQEPSFSSQIDINSNVVLYVNLVQSTPRQASGSSGSSSSSNISAYLTRNIHSPMGKFSSLSSLKSNKAFPNFKNVNFK